jgi:hypothetical protein
LGYLVACRKAGRLNLSTANLSATTGARMHDQLLSHGRRHSSVHLPTRIQIGGGSVVGEYIFDVNDFRSDNKDNIRRGTSS